MIRAPSHCGCWISRFIVARLIGMPAPCSRMHSSAKMLSMKRWSRVSLVSQLTTSPSDCGVTESMLGGAFMAGSGAGS
jgi:hypothetical protein